MIAERDRDVATGPSLRLPDAPKLLEGLRAVDGGCIVPHRRIDVVGAAVASYGAFMRSGRSVSSPAVHDIIFDERISRPTVEGQISVARRRPDAGIIINGSGRRSGRPAFADHEIAAIRP